MRKNKCTISIDWLQVLCTRSDYRTDTESWFTSSQQNQFGHHNTYIVKDAVEWTAGYEQCRSVFLNNIAVAHIAWNPRRSNVDIMNCSVKLSNNLLYTNMWHFILGDLTNALGWRVKNITRLDIACDFNYFMHGLNPEAFIQKYVRGKQQSYIRTKSNKFSIVGEKTKNGSRIDYIRWGTRSSGVCTYLYNKSKEMMECKMKPWVIEKWRNAGLDIKKTWRVEFSINSNGRGLKDIETNIIHNLFVDDIDTQERTIQIFHTYAKQYFNFKRCGKNEPIYVKDMHSVELLDTSQALNMKPCQLYTATKKASAVQNCIVTIELLKDDLRHKENCNIQSQIDSIETTQALLMEKLRQSIVVDMTEEQIKKDIQKRIEHSINRMTYNETMLRYNSFMDNTAYKEDVCLRTATRITKLLLSRRGNMNRAYS